jgi:periplasmic divalent cation tolerance protein
MPTAQPFLAFVTAPPGDAQRIARALVERELAACVNIVAGVNSTYRWEGAVQEDEEALLLVKTTRAALARVELLLDEIHPYETFELVAMAIDGGSSPYLDWIQKSVKEP